MSYSIIAAIGKNNELGKGNELIWRFKEDMKFFKETTLDHKVIMGSKTFQSLPFVLPRRENIVISSKNEFPSEVLVFHNIEDILNEYKNLNEEIFIIGGASIYKTFLPYCDKLYLTEIDSECKEATAYFPIFDKDLYKKEILSEKMEDVITFKHVLYIRK